jgi:hypothetical protein
VGKIAAALGASPATRRLAETLGGLAIGVASGMGVGHMGGGGGHAAPVELSPDEVQETLTHPLGKVTGIDHHTGVPIVDRTQASEAVTPSVAEQTERTA